MMMLCMYNSTMCSAQCSISVTRSHSGHQCERMPSHGVISGVSTEFEIVVEH